MSLAKVYEPCQVESKWYQFWLEQNYFHAEVEKGKKPYCIVIPPPNVTGVLHLGHALDNTLQDILIRFHRKLGDDTLWLPGTDHAGIATQAKVEESLAGEGLNRMDLGREEILKRVWQWKQQYGGRIINQLKELGSSCDWQRERFTMDEGCSQSVREAFLHLYQKGLIYRGSYLINWCPKCRTTISDIEVEHEERQGQLWWLRYPLADGSGFIEVATTRPETMLGDTAVAVNSTDKRYRKLVGQTVILPIIKRPIPIVADDYVDQSFGSGAVKVTPAHDPNDFEIGLRHNLPQITVIDFDATMTEAAGPYQGQERYQCRAQLVKDLEEQGFLVKVEPYTNAVGQCYRCDTVIEPLISKQWFVKMKPLAEPAIRAVTEGRIEFVPERFTKIYLGWLENIRDWCISRQLWWGHRIPVWYCQDCQEMIVSRDEPSECSNCGSTNLLQDPDVLDTWFSSALWPFSTLGWPETTPELKYFYPTTVLVTGRDIIFFWVARMIFMGLECTATEPFEKVLIHGLVLDKDGKKMSKSRPETIVDPQEMIDHYGADTLRFTLATGTALGQDQRFQMEKIEGSRNFANKIWNAARFILIQQTTTIESGSEASTIPLSAELQAFASGQSAHLDPQLLALADQWILSRLQQLIGKVTKLMEEFELGEAATLIYEFIWSEYCDWYIELSKPRLNQTNDLQQQQVAQAILARVLRQALELLHPFMPFLTEEIWQVLPHQGPSIVIAPWPEAEPQLQFNKAETEMDLVIAVVRALRNLRSEAKIQPQQRVTAICSGNTTQLEILQRHQSYLKILAGLEEQRFVTVETAPPKQALSAVAAGITVYLPVAGLIDLDRERERLAKEIAQLEQELERLKSRMASPAFSAKAPPEVIAKETAKLESFTVKAEQLKRRLSELA